MPWWKSVPKKIWGHAKKIEISPKRYKKDKGEKRLQNPGFEPWNPRIADKYADRYTTETYRDRDKFQLSL